LFYYIIFNVPISQGCAIYQVHDKEHARTHISRLAPTLTWKAYLVIRTKGDDKNSRALYDKNKWLPALLKERPKAGSYIVMIRSRTNAVHCVRSAFSLETAKEPSKTQSWMRLTERIAHETAICGNPHNSSNWDSRIARQLGCKYTFCQNVVSTQKLLANMPIFSCIL
jgi:hypothetical protein